MASDEHTRIVAALLENPELANHPSIRAAIVRLAELASVADGRAFASQSLLDQQDRDARTLRAALESLQSERRAQHASALRLITSGTPDPIRAPLEAAVAIEPGDDGYQHCADLRVFDGARVVVSLAQLPVGGVAAALAFAEWRTLFYDPGRTIEAALPAALCDQWTRLCDAVGADRGALFCAVIDLSRRELVARCCGGPQGALVIGRSVLTLSDCELELAVGQPVFAIESHTAEQLALVGPNKNRSGIDALNATPVTRLRELLLEHRGHRSLAMIGLMLNEASAIPVSKTPPDIGDDEAELAWVEELSRAGVANGDTVRGLATRYARLARRLVKIGKISDSYQRELRTSSLALEEANADLAEFSGRVAHDLKTPLTAIIGFASMLGEEPFCSDPALVRATVKDLLWSSAKMVDIIDALLLLAKARRGAVAMEPVALASVFDEVTRRIEPLANERRATVRADADASVACGHGPWIEAAIVNLATNAIRYGGAPPSVTILAREDGANVILSVSDNGRGLTESEQSKLFQPFVRLSKDAGGHGLGLTIVRRVVERMNGVVRVHSVVGQGSVFSIVLPKATEGASP
ncbi:MAG: HAMP domain-containing histidine kinase [Myxococcales bacterium]|nr:HAMP domain-containing histidine kinase [Myxococcales bacterium]